MNLRIFTFLLVGPFFMTASGFSADAPKESVTWALAVHGGAGVNLVKLGEEGKKLKKEGLAEGLEAGKAILANGGSALEAVEAVIRVFEDSSKFNAGRGAVRTNTGAVELDASIMDGKTKQCGAIACVTNVKNPITLAKLVMTETKHVLLVGKGAEEFALAQKVPIVDKAYFLGEHRQTSTPTLVIQNSATDDPRHGTVGCVALDSHGNLAAGTSTGGTSKKMPGRVGDSPIIGAGTYASNDTCAVSGTGIGEEYIRNAVAYDVAAQMRYANRSLEVAVTEIIQKRLMPDDGGIIAVSKDGEIVLQHNTPGMACGAANSVGRFDTYLQAP